MQTTEFQDTAYGRLGSQVFASRRKSLDENMKTNFELNGYSWKSKLEVYALADYLLCIRLELSRKVAPFFRDIGF